MIKTGKQGTVLVVNNVKHELAKDQEVMNFTVYDTYTGLDGKKHRKYYRIKSWEDVPLVNKQKIRIAYITRVDVFELFLKDRDREEICLTFTAKIEKVT